MRSVTVGTSTSAVFTASTSCGELSGVSSALSRVSNNSISRVSMASGSFRVTITSGFFFELVGMSSGPAGAQQRKGSGLPIPRFASLRPDEANVRTGPGPRYPIDWVFKRKGMPVEIVAEYDNGRKIRDWQGASGWVHQSLLSGKRGFIIPAKPASVH